MIESLDSFYKNNAEGIRLRRSTKERLSLIIAKTGAIGLSISLGSYMLIPTAALAQVSADVGFSSQAVAIEQASEDAPSNSGFESDTNVVADISGAIDGAAIPSPLSDLGANSLAIQAFSLDADSWADRADTSWYDESKTSFEISSAEALAGLARLVNAGNRFEGKTFALTCDIDLENLEWTPIGYLDSSFVSSADLAGSSHKPFSGTFDGGGHKISGLTLSDTFSSKESRKFSLGLFGAVYNGSVLNLNVVGSVVSENASGARGVGVLCGWIFESRVINCAVDASVVSGSTYTGGVVGNVKSNSVVRGCVMRGSVTLCPVSSSKGASLGGIAGYLSSSCNMASNINYASVTSTADAMANIGGVVGVVNASGLAVVSCKNYGSVQGDCQGVGGVIGCAITSSSEQLELVDCYNAGSVKSTTSSYDSTSCIGVGGVVGSLRGFVGSYDKTLRRCANEGAVEYAGSLNNASAGGLIGYSYLKPDTSSSIAALDIGALNIEGCYSTGKVSSSASYEVGNNAEGEASDLGVDSSTALTSSSESLGGVAALVGKGDEVALNVAASYSAGLTTNQDSESSAISPLVSALPQSYSITGFYYASDVFAEFIANEDNSAEDDSTQASEAIGITALQAADMQKAPFTTALNEVLDVFEAPSANLNSGFPALKANEDSALFSADVSVTASVTYNGCAQRPQIVVYSNGSTALVEGKDYSVAITKDGTECVSDDDFINAGSYNVHIVGIGSHIGSVDKTYTISQLTLSAANLTQKQKKVTYKASAYTFDELIEANGWVAHDGDLTIAPLRESCDLESLGTQYFVVNPGTSGNTTIGYSGAGPSFQFKITAGEFNLGAIELIAYTGEVVSVSLNATNTASPDVSLVFGRDFVVDYYTNASGIRIDAANMIEPGKYSAVCKGLGNYAGSTSRVNFEVTYGSFLVSDVIELSYTGQALTPQFSVTDSVSGKVLESGDYTFHFETAEGQPDNASIINVSDIVDVGDYVLVVEGAGARYKSDDCVKTTFKVVNKNFNVVQFSTFGYTGSDVLSSVEIYSDAKIDIDAFTGEPCQKLLTRGVDYTFELEYFNEVTQTWETAKNAVNRGSYKLVISGTGDYYGSVERNFSIGSADIYAVEASNVTFTGQILPFDLNVFSAQGIKLNIGVDYTVSCTLDGVAVDPASLFSAGVYSVAVEGIGNYAGKLTTMFEVRQAQLGADDLDSVYFSGFENPLNVVAYASDYLLDENIFGVRAVKNGMTLGAKDLIHAGTYDVEVYVLPEYEANFEEGAREVYKSFEVKMADAEMASIANLSYDGLSHAVTPDLINTTTGVALNPDIYTVAYSDSEHEMIKASQVIDSGDYYVAYSIKAEYKNDLSADYFESAFKIGILYLTMPTIANVVYTGDPVVPNVYLESFMGEPGSEVEGEVLRLKSSEYYVWYTDSTGVNTIAPEDLIKPGSYRAYARTYDTGGNYDQIVHWNTFNIVMTYDSQGSEERNEGVIAGNITGESGEGEASGMLSGTSASMRDVVLASTMSAVDASAAVAEALAEDAATAAAKSQSIYDDSSSYGASDETGSSVQDTVSEDVLAATDGVAGALSTVISEFRTLPTAVKVLLILLVLVVCGCGSEFSLRRRYKKLYEELSKM